MTQIFSKLENCKKNQHMRPGTTKGTLRRENKNSFLMYYA